MFKIIVLILMPLILYLVIIFQLSNLGLDLLYIFAIPKKELLKENFVKAKKKLKNILIEHLLDLMVFSINQL